MRKPRRTVSCGHRKTARLCKRAKVKFRKTKAGSPNQSEVPKAYAEAESFHPGSKGLAEVERLESIGRWCHRSREFQKGWDQAVRVRH